MDSVGVDGDCCCQTEAVVAAHDVKIKSVFCVFIIGVCVEKIKRISVVAQTNLCWGFCVSPKIKKTSMKRQHKPATRF